MNPFAYKHGLYFSIFPCDLYFTLYTHLLQMSFCCGGFGTKSYVLLSINDWLSWSIAYFYDIEIEEDIASSYDWGSCMKAPTDARNAWEKEMVLVHSGCKIGDSIWNISYNEFEFLEKLSIFGVLSKSSYMDL